MIAGAVEVFGENSPGCAELRRIMDQSGPTLKAFLKDATEPGTWIAADGWAGCDGLSLRGTGMAFSDAPVSTRWRFRCAERSAGRQDDSRIVPSQRQQRLPASGYLEPVDRVDERERPTDPGLCHSRIGSQPRNRVVQTSLS